MLFTISAKHVDAPEAVKEYARKKVSNLPRYYNSINEVEVVLDGGQGGNVSVELIARAAHGKPFVVTEADKEVYRCIDSAVHKLERQIRKRKARERDNKHTGSSKPA